MNYRTNPKNGDKLSILGFGCMRFADSLAGSFGMGKKADPEKAGELAKHRFAPCALGPTWAYKSPHHTCQKHAQAAPETVEARVIWVGKSLREPQRKGG